MRTVNTNNNRLTFNCRQSLVYGRDCNNKEIIVDTVAEEAIKTSSKPSTISKPKDSNDKILVLQEFTCAHVTQGSEFSETK